MGLGGIPRPSQDGCPAPRHTWHDERPEKVTRTVNRLVRTHVMTPVSNGRA